MNLLCKECVFVMKLMSEQEIKNAIDNSRLELYKTYDTLYDHVEGVHHLVCVKEHDGTFEKARRRFLLDHVAHCAFCQKEDSWRNEQYPLLRPPTIDQREGTSAALPVPSTLEEIEKSSES